MNIQPFNFRSFEFKESVIPHVDALSLTNEIVLPTVIDPPMPQITEAELEAVRLEALAAGREQGFAEAQAAIDKKAQDQQTAIQALLQAVGEQLKTLQEETARNQQQQAGFMVQLALKMAQKVAAKAMEAEPFNAIEPMLSDCFAMLENEPRLKIVVAPELVSILQEKLLSGSGNAEQIMDVSQDEAMQVGDCRVLWRNGKAERDVALLWQEMEAMLERTFDLKPVTQEPKLSVLQQEPELPEPITLQDNPQPLTVAENPNHDQQEDQSDDRRRGNVF